MSNSVKAALGGILVLLVGFFFFRSGGESEPVGRKGIEVDSKSADAVRQRLDQLRSSRELSAPAAPEDVHVEKVAPQAPAAPAKVNRPAMPQPAAPMVADAPAADKVPPAPRGGNVTGGTGLHESGVDDIPTLKGVAVNDKDPEKRLEAVTLLGATEEPDVVPVLGQALSDEDPEVRLAAIQALADFTGDAPFDLLGKAATDDPEADNRYEALEALSDLEDDRSKVYAKKLLQDPDEDVRDLAESMLGMDEEPNNDPAMKR